MPGRLFTVIAVLLPLLACSSKNRPGAPVLDSGSVSLKVVVPPDARPAATVAATADAGVRLPAEIIVGSDRGLEAWQLDGSGKRVISRGVAAHPRWLDDQHVLVLVPRDSDLSKGGRIERISVVDGKRSTLAKLPPFACKPSPGTEADEGEMQLGLDLQDPGDFTIDRQKQQACLSLMDRNENMAGFAVEVLVDLKSGKVSRWLTLGEDSCVPPVGVKLAKSADNLNCVATPETSREPATPPVFPFTFTDDGILKKGSDEAGTPMLSIPGYEPDLSGPSPSGRWLALSGDQEDGDYIHRLLVLLDREQGEVYPIVLKRSWPSPLRPVGKRNPPRIKTPIAKTASVVGETDVRWQGTSSDSEYLIVDDLVIKPGAFSFSVKGEIAR